MNVEFAVQQGMTSAEYGEEIGLSHGKARLRAQMAGLRFKRQTEKTPRDIVQGMRPLEAIEYLLGIIEAFEELDEPVPAWVDDLSLTPRRYAILLLRRKGRIVSQDAAFNAIYASKSDGELPGSNVVKVWVNQIRKSLPSTLEVRNNPGLGYGIFERRDND